MDGCTCELLGLQILKGAAQANQTLLFSSLLSRLTASLPNKISKNSCFSPTIIGGSDSPLQTLKTVKTSP